jgi:hypothetical protein
MHHEPMSSQALAIASRLERWARCDVEVERTRATSWSATLPLLSPLMSSIGGTGVSSSLPSIR